MWVMIYDLKKLKSQFLAYTNLENTWNTYQSHICYQQLEELRLIILTRIVLINTEMEWARSNAYVKVHTVINTTLP